MVESTFDVTSIKGLEWAGEVGVMRGLVKRYVVRETIEV